MDTHMSMISTSMRSTLTLALMGAALPLTSESAYAQGATYYACYVPSSGTVYRIKEPGLKQQCGSSNKSGNHEQHVEFSWSSGMHVSLAAPPGGNGGDPGAKQVDHGSLIGLNDDDHSQYLLADGARTTINGFSVNGSFGQGHIPATGAGSRLMWYPRKAAFRVGLADAEWDDGNIGNLSVAMGYRTRASGEGSFAAGWGSDASSAGSTAIGHGAVASGANSTAIGNSVIASGYRSMALGTHASTNGKSGAFVYGDFSSGSVQAQADNQFAVRAQRFWFGNNNNVTATTGRLIETSTGAYLSSGGAWVSSSDVAKKTRFEDVEGELVLEKLASMPIRTWSYRVEDAVRHMGPTAQDFRSAFGLGDTDKAIAGVDADGVSLAAIQALEKRTARVRELVQLVEQQDARIRDLEAAVQALQHANRTKN